MQDHLNLVYALIDLARKAGNIIMDIYQSEITVKRKSDSSLVTNADHAAEAAILEGLSIIAPDIPVISEEATHDGYTPAIRKRFFLVDPLDGTAEFVKRNGEFTVNIALIDQGTALMGVIFAPAINRLFVGVKDFGAFELNPNQEKAAEELMKSACPLSGLKQDDVLRKNPPQEFPLLSAMLSRSYGSLENEEFLERLGISKKIIKGSSLKFCGLAAGEAAVYPRFGRTMEWDTAAGQAILQAAGGTVVTVDGQPLTYGKTDSGYENPPFIAWASSSLARQARIP